MNWSFVRLAASISTVAILVACGSDDPTTKASEDGSIVTAPPNSGGTDTGGGGTDTGGGGGTTTKYSVGGSAAGLTGTVVLQNSGGDDLTVDADGAFTFATKVPDGGTYAVSVKSDSIQACTVADGDGKVAGTNVTGVALNCSLRPISRVSVKTGGAQAGDWSLNPSISRDGRYVAFESKASLVAEDTNNVTDIYVHDRETGTTTRVSLASDGQEANGASEGPSISADGRYVAFFSGADNLVADDTNFVRDVFVRDLVAGTTTRVSLKTGGLQATDHSEGPSISADGRYVAFESSAGDLVDGDTNAMSDVFVHDREASTTTRVSIASVTGDQANGPSTGASISADGRYVAFSSGATNLGASNGTSNVFVRDREDGTTTLVSVAANGDSYAPSISADGRYVAFASEATDLVAGDVNGRRDVFVRDLAGATTTLASVSSTNTQGTFDSPAANSKPPSISADGRYVVFASDALLVGTDTNNHRDVFVRDVVANETRRISISQGGAEGNNQSNNAVISADGRYVAFDSSASNLVTGDTNTLPDVFVAPAR